jgi:hypothetical protein
MTGVVYHDWNSSLSGYVPPDPRMGRSFQSLEELQAAFSNDWKIRDGLRAEMIALQEEMDWIVYEAYGLIPADHPAVMGGPGAPRTAARTTECAGHLQREHRPFVLWQQAVAAIGDRGSGPGSATPATEIFDKAAALIPADWPDERQTLWRARLEAIRDNEHIRRIEQPVYKRRWDEQWKVGNRWQCGEVAYQAEFADAFDWWLSEKAEWWLEKEWHGRLAREPVDLATWTAALWSDPRVQAAWAMRCSLCAERPDFGKYFRNLVKEQSVPADIPWAVPWEELEKKRKIPAAVKRIRGKLNVPRERFRTTEEGRFVWAGASMFCT